MEKIRLKFTQFRKIKSVYKLCREYIPEIRELTFCRFWWLTNFINKWEIEIIHSNGLIPYGILILERATREIILLKYHYLDIDKESKFQISLHFNKYFTKRSVEGLKYIIVYLPIDCDERVLNVFKEDFEFIEERHSSNRRYFTPSNQILLSKQLNYGATI